MKGMAQFSAYCCRLVVSDFDGCVVFNYGYVYHTFDNPSELPTLISLAGLSAQWQWYLYEKIREFCPVTDRDL